MTIQKLLAKIRDEKPNSFGDDRLISFINEIEIDVAKELNYEQDDYPLYDSTDTDEELLAPAPYDRLYVSYVKSQVDYANEEYGSYQNNAAQHVQDFQDFVDWVVRENKAIDRSFPYTFVNIL